MINHKTLYFTSRSKFLDYKFTLRNLMHIEEIIIVLMSIRSITINKCLKNNEQVIKTYNIIYPVCTSVY